MVKTEEAIGAKDVVLPVAPPKTIIREYFEQGVVTVTMALFLMTSSPRRLKSRPGRCRTT
jgi:hypothetical protein